MTSMNVGTVEPNSTRTVAQSLVSRRAAAVTTAATASTPSTAPASTASQGISSNDFLTLLVTEMKNQDPTQPTDPNAYIQQLVGVNSLQQLISINQALTSTASAPVTPSAPGSPTTPATGAITAPLAGAS